MTPSPSSEGQDLAALSDTLHAKAWAWEHGDADDDLGHWLTQAADAISSLLKEAEGLREERDQVVETFTAETIERALQTKRADDLEAQLSAATKRAEAAEGALKELHAMVWGEAPHLLDEDRGGSARLDLEIEAILNRPRALTGEGAER